MKFVSEQYFSVYFVAVARWLLLLLSFFLLQCDWLCGTEFEFVFHSRSFRVNDAKTLCFRMLHCYIKHRNFLSATSSYHYHCHGCCHCQLWFKFKTIINKVMDSEWTMRCSTCHLCISTRNCFFYPEYMHKVDIWKLKRTRAYDKSSHFGEKIANCLEYLCESNSKSLW